MFMNLLKSKELITHKHLEFHCNNTVEEWHMGFSSLLDANHTSIWKFIEGQKNH